MGVRICVTLISFIAARRQQWIEEKLQLGTIRCTLTNVDENLVILLRNDI